MGWLHENCKSVFLGRLLFDYAPSQCKRVLPVEVENIDPCHKYLHEHSPFWSDVPTMIEWGLYVYASATFTSDVLLSTFPISFPLSFTLCIDILAKKKVLVKREGIFGAINLSKKWV